MLKLHTDCIKYITNLIDTRSELTHSDFEYITASIIQATPVIQLPSVDDMDRDMKLLDMLAAYMKTHDRDKGQDILDYMVNNAVKYFEPNIEDIINERYQQSAPARREAAEEKRYHEYLWNKDRL